MAVSGYLAAEGKALMIMRIRAGAVRTAKIVAAAAGLGKLLGLAWRNTLGLGDWESRDRRS